MHREQLSTHQKLDIAFNRILYIYSIVNFFILFFSLKIPPMAYFYYTSSCIIFFVTYLVIHESGSVWRWQRIFSRLPDVLILCGTLFLGLPVNTFLFYLLGRQTLVSIRNRSLGYSNLEKSSFFDYLSVNPPGFFLMSFILTICVGTILLMLPAATSAHTETPFINALFTATSATCVTGLIVVDTGTYFSLFGQLVILALIQIGALGIMTISASFFVLIGQKMKMRSENLIQDVVGESNKFDMKNLVKNIVLMTMSFEFIGAALLYFNFNDQFGDGLYTLYLSVFHAISAFCNAGFSIFSDSLMRWYAHIPMNLIISGLIIIGGIGFPVLQDVFRIIKEKRKPVHLHLHSKIVIFTTLVLILLGTILFFIAEYNNIMKDYSLDKRIIASFFQSVTTRTAGFNTIDNSQLSDSSVLSSIVLMFVGASPGSTGGGLKTTSLFILFATVVTMFKGQKHATAFNRRISENYIKRVLALTTSSITLMCIMIFLLMHFEHLEFSKILFEAFSAFGTVGLSMGITSQLSNNGKMVIIILMYLGRVGPLTFGYAIVRNVKKTQFEFIEEKINIG